MIERKIYFEKIKPFIDKDIIKPGGKENWGIIHGPGSPVDRLNIKKGLEGIKEMPKVYNIEIKGEK